MVRLSKLWLLDGLVIIVLHVGKDAIKEMFSLGRKMDYLFLIEIQFESRLVEVIQIAENKYSTV